MSLARVFSLSGRRFPSRVLCTSPLSGDCPSPPPPPSPSTGPTGKEFNKAVRSLFNVSDPTELAARFKALSSISPHFRAKPSIYSAVITRLAASHHLDAIVDILEAQKLTPSITHEGFAARVISLYGKAKLPEKAYETFLHLPDLGCPRSVVSFNGLLWAFSASGEYERAVQTFRDVPEGVVLDVYSYNIMVRVMCLKGEMEKAMELVGVMEEAGFEANLVTYTTLLTGYYSVNNGCSLEDGEKVWEMMRQKGCAPDMRCFNVKIRTLSFQGKLAEAREVMELARSAGLSPDAFSYTALIKGECKAGNLEGAKEVFVEMRKRDISPNGGTFQAILPGLTDAGELDMALKLCKDSISRKCYVPVEALQGVVDQLVEKSRANDAKNLVKFALSSGMYTSDTLVMPPVCEGS